MDLETVLSIFPASSLPLNRGSLWVGTITGLDYWTTGLDLFTQLLR